MRKIVMLFYTTMVSVLACAQGTEMVVPGNFWMYNYEKEVAYFAIVNETKKLNGQTYYKATLERLSKGSLAKGLGINSPFSGVHSSKIWLREADGKVFAHKDEYIAMMREFYTTEGSELFLEENGHTEVLLYDFKLSVGDRYPCEGDVTVSAVDNLTTRDGEVRRMLNLSNGMILIKGIGCINSWGEIFGYQNFGPAVDCQGEVYEYLPFDFICAGNIVYSNGDTSGIGRVSSNPRATKHDDAIYSIQGNKVTKSQGDRLPKGVYIQNGRKFVVK